MSPRNHDYHRRRLLPPSLTAKDDAMSSRIRASTALLLSSASGPTIGGRRRTPEGLRSRPRNNILPSRAFSSSPVRQTGMRRMRDDVVVDEDDSAAETWISPRNLTSAFHLERRRNKNTPSSLKLAHMAFEKGNLRFTRNIATKEKSTIEPVYLDEKDLKRMAMLKIQHTEKMANKITNKTGNAIISRAVKQKCYQESGAEKKRITIEQAATERAVRKNGADKAKLIAGEEKNFPDCKRISDKKVEKAKLETEGNKLRKENVLLEEEIVKVPLSLKFDHKSVIKKEKLTQNIIQKTKLDTDIEEKKSDKENEIVEEQLENIKLQAKAEDEQFSHDHLLEEETGKSAAQVAADEESLNENQRPARGEICKYGSALEANRKDISVGKKKLLDQSKKALLDTKTAPLDTTTEDEILAEEEMLAVKGIEKVGLAAEGEEKGLNEKNEVTEEQMEEAQLGLEANEKRVDDNEKVGKEHEENKIIDEELEKVKLSNKVQDVQFSH
eukprot:CAMPEP_0113301040 /NCGR_PEP_ID=MMETSP0010_2-20120614/2432_1 /TAXON_ID=216773 ORGANISM="Corethron hystrix, Strain 308" /NCGR_SAMPLE_ID=MMETSP0010_2 /ASSEMBLY_ACC=CAM_ASM_000155 /LENGTH=498 /DNA_ID=CAMNT_0000154591 /DNA_START=52 /DNA_END=1545 /DNA_ORIENTATION=- /assembly_acc=CAM_ASM_000155